MRSLTSKTTIVQSLESLVIHSYGRRKASLVVVKWKGVGFLMTQVITRLEARFRERGTGSCVACTEFQGRRCTMSRVAFCNVTLLSPSPWGSTFNISTRVGICREYVPTRSDFPLHSPCYLFFENPWYWFENSRKRAKYSNSEEYDDLSHLIDSDRTISGYPRTFLPTIRGEIYRRRGRLLTTKIGVSDGGGGPDDDDNRTRLRRPRQR